MEGATQGSSAGMGKQGKHPLGHVSPEGSSWFGALEAEPPRDAEGRRGAGTPHSTPAQIPALTYKSSNVTPQDAPILLRAKPQCSSRATKSPRAIRSSQATYPPSLLCPRPCPLLVKAL